MQHNSRVNLHFIKVSMENDNNFGYVKITILVDNIPLSTAKPALVTTSIKLVKPALVTTSIKLQSNLL